jgi:hypothetical protein
MFQSKGLPAFLGNRFFLEAQKKEERVVKRAREKTNYLLYMDENVTHDGKLFTRKKYTFSHFLLVV